MEKVLFKSSVPVLVVLQCLLIPASLLAQAPVHQPEQADKNLKSFFSELLKKKSAVGGTVLRGDNDESPDAISSASTGLLLENQSVFKVLPGSQSVLLKWRSPAKQAWQVDLGQTSQSVQGGQALVELPNKASHSLSTWQLNPVGPAAAEMSGYWFYAQDIHADDAQELLAKLGQHRAMGLTHSSNYQAVCHWMYQEKLMDFNQWCIKRP